MRRYFNHVVDIMNVPSSGDSASAVCEVNVPSDIDVLDCDCLVLGGGTGGTAAALAALRNDLQVILVEETNWLGGQFTSQGIAALDEHEYIEIFGGTASYMDLRERIRRKMAGQIDPGKDGGNENPGVCWVSNLAFFPGFAASVVDDLMEPFEASGAARILRRSKLVGASTESGRVTEVVLMNLDDRSTYLSIKPKTVVDATEFGDLLPLLGCDFKVGAEAVSETGEPSAQPESGRPDYSQGLTYAFACELRPEGEVHTVPEPENYRTNRLKQPYSFEIEVHGGEIYGEVSGRLAYRLYERMPGTKGGVWTYRRLLAVRQVPEPHVGDVSMFNWPSNDYSDPLLLLGNAHEIATSLQKAKQLSLGFLHWLQTEAPTEAESAGAPELLLRCDVMGTTDGLSQHPYVRESRRIVAIKTIVEQDVAIAFNEGPRARICQDSVGIGWYPIDIHPSGPLEVATSTRTRPFQIPLGALIPIGLTNVIAGSKNIGTTHITNGCFRLHPVEWNVGESAGLLAAFCAKHACSTSDVHENNSLLTTFQMCLLRSGVPLYWELDHPPTHPYFIASQVLCLAGVLDDSLDLNFRPDAPVSLEIWQEVSGRGECPRTLSEAIVRLSDQASWDRSPEAHTPPRPDAWS